MIERIPFGRSGHHSSRAIFGAAALWAMKPERVDAVLALLDEFGVNHIDVAASYGEAELRLAPSLAARRADFFLATKTGERTKSGAHDELRRSLERMNVDSVDLVQMHNLVDEGEWKTAMGRGGVLEALVAARDEGLVRFIGVTGHGTQVAKRHRQSLDAFAFDSVLLPYSFVMMRDPQYAEEFEALYEMCRDRGVAVQTIKSIARRRWKDDDDPRRFSWYMPLTADAAIERAVSFVLARPGLFLNTSSDARLLRQVLAACDGAGTLPDEARMRQDVDEQGIEPLFVRGVAEDVRI